MEPVRVFVGTTEDQMLSTRVLEFSIRRATRRAVTVFPLHKAGVSYPLPKDPGNRPRTPFSFQRFLIPSLCGYRGKALYLDSDMQVFGDIGEVFDLDMDRHELFTVASGGFTRRRQFSVMLLNCERLRWNVTGIVGQLDRGEIDYHGLIHEMRLAPKISERIRPEWNHLEKFVSGKTKLLHYTDMPTQPWVSTANKLGAIWTNTLLQAVEAGFIDRSLIAEHAAGSWVRPSLLFQLDYRILDSRELPKEAIELDKNFVAPYKRLAHVNGQATVRVSPAPKFYGRGVSWLKRRLETFVER